LLYFKEKSKPDQMMKSINIFMILLMTGTIASAQTDKSTLILKANDHPRIILLKGEEKAIKQTIATDEIWKKLDQFIITESDKIIEKSPVERVLIGRRLLDKSREALSRIFYLSYAYRMTADSKYLDRAEKEMLAVSSFSDWNPSHFLDVAEMTMAVSIGYDWLYSGLSSGTRNTIKAAIIEKGLKPSLMPENSYWANGSNNWNQVCNAGMAYGGLAVFEDEKKLATDIIQRAIGSITLPMGDYEPDGAYPEGYSYWGYGTSFNIMFLSAMEKAFGKDFGLIINPGFFKTAAYLENMTGPTGNSFNYSDAGSGGGINPTMFWFAGRMDDPSLLWSERYYLKNKNLPNDRLLPAVMIWGAGITMDKITTPLKTVWVGQGKNPVALMRTSWTDRNAIYVGLKAGSPSVNHGHMDAGSFIMEANGERWTMDFGMQDYNSLETAGVDLWNMKQNSQRWEVYRYNNFVHNTLTVNNKLQEVDGYSSIISWSDKPDMMNARTDITALYKNDLKRVERGIAIVDNKYVIIRDEVESSDKEAVVKWNLLTSANVTVIGKNSAEFTKNGKKLVLKVKSPASAEIKTWSTIPPHSYDAPNPGSTLVGFEITVPANSKADLVVLMLPEGAEENVRVTAKTLAEWPK
jgi:hypothetical protein